MPDKNKKEELLNLDLTLNKNDFKYVFCRACGGEMRHSPLIICSDCLGDEIDKFYKVATYKDDESDE